MSTRSKWRRLSWFKRAEYPQTWSRRERALRFEPLEARLALATVAAVHGSIPSSSATATPADDTPQPIEVSGNTLQGTGEGGEVVEVYFVAKNDFWVYINGNAWGEYLVGSGDSPPGGLDLIDNIDFNGGGGSEQAILDDAFNNYTDTVNSSYSQLVAKNNTFTLTTYNCPFQDFYGTAASTVTYNDDQDTAGVNSFAATTQYTVMYYGADTHSEIAAFGPATATANSSDPTKDVAYFYVSSASVQGAYLATTPATSTSAFNAPDPINPSVTNNVVQIANNFNTVLAIGNGTQADKASLSGASTGTNTYDATQFYSWMSGPTASGTYSDCAMFFGATSGTSASHGNDYDYLYAPAGVDATFESFFSGTDDPLGAITDEIRVSGSNLPVYTGINFATTLAVGNSLSIDTAAINTPDSGTSYLAGSPNTFFAAGSYGLLVTGSPNSSQVWTSVTGFDDVTVYNEESTAGSELLSSYSYNLTFDGSWTKLAGSI